MNNKKYLKATPAMALMLSLFLTSCGTQDSQTLVIQEETTQASAENVQTPEAAENTAEADNPLAQRDSLEWEQRLDYTTERGAQLAEITVELAQDTEAVQEKAQGLLDAMAGGDAEAAVDSILDQDWYTVMLSDLLIGQRNYTGTTENGEWRLLILADELGQHGTAIEYPLADGRTFYVQVTDSEIRDYVCAAEKTGEFTSELLNLTDGTYTGYEGTLSAGSRPEGKLTIHVGTTDNSNGAAEAFHSRSAQTVVYEGDFTAEGEPSTATPANITKEGRIAYAARQEGKSTYYLTVTTEEAAEAFTPEQLGICNIWE